MKTVGKPLSKTSEGNQVHISRKPVVLPLSDIKNSPSQDHPFVPRQMDDAKLAVVRAMERIYMNTCLPLTNLSEHSIKISRVNGFQVVQVRGFQFWQKREVSS